MQSRNSADGSESPSGLLRVNEAAQQLSVSVRSVWRLIALGELEQVRVGRCVRVSKASLAAFIAKGGAR